MSKYTTQVRFICENYARLDPHQRIDIETATPNEIIEVAAPYVFNFDFPIYDENYRLPLEIKILRHFYTREISEETVALWKLRLDDRLNMIMPFYNALYQSSLLEFNPLYDVNYTKTGSRDGEDTHQNVTNENLEEEKNINRSRDKTSRNVENENTDRSKSTSGDADGTQSQNSHSETDSNSETIDLFSDTPQGSLEIFGIETPPQQTVIGNSWLTTADRTTNTSHDEADTNSAGTTHDEYTGSETEGIERERINSDTENEEGNEAHEGSSSKTTTGRGMATSLEQYSESVVGKMGGKSYAELLLEFRKTFLKIDKMLIDELDDLFFGLWN